MRFYTRTHRNYCGVDLHARSMYVCVMNQEGEVLLHRNLACDAALSSVDTQNRPLMDI
jgi:hypothetical protein